MARFEGAILGSQENNNGPIRDVEAELCGFSPANVGQYWKELQEDDGMPNAAKPRGPPTKNIEFLATCYRGVCWGNPLIPLYLRYRPRPFFPRPDLATAVATLSQKRPTSLIGGPGKTTDFEEVRKFGKDSKKMLKDFKRF